MTIRRLGVAALVLAGAAVAWPEATQAQRPGPDDAVTPVSLALVRAGDAALARNQPAAATDLFEAAVAADPKNRAGFIGLARAAQAQGLPGKAIKFYREALQLEPNDLAALEGQGQALVARGAIVRAQANLDRIRSLCKTECPPAARLAAAIARPPQPATPAPNTTAAIAQPVPVQN